MPFESILCSACTVFKPLEMYPTLLYKPDQASEVELYQLAERRRREKQLVIERDVGDKSPWFMISAAWI